MYNEYFNLSEQPFHLTPDTEYFYEATPHKEALQTILVSLKQHEAFIKVTGPVGTGKTMLCRELLNRINQDYKFAYIPNPALPAVDFYKMIIHELTGERVAANTAFEVQTLLTHTLMEFANSGQRVVLIIDEAQSMPDETLESVRLITNLETEKSKLLQVVLFAQPELDEKLNQHDFRQLKQRIIFSNYLRPLYKDEFLSYVAYRVTAAGNQYQDLFAEGALDKIYKASAGIPRLVNILCHKSLISAYANSHKKVLKQDALKAIEDTESTSEAQEHMQLENAKKYPHWTVDVAVGLSILFIFQIIWLAVGGRL